MDFIKSQVMEQFDLHHERKEKPTATPADWRRFVTAAFDPSIPFKLPRERNQFLFVMGSVTFGVSRPGETITSRGYEVDNGAMQWRDVRFFLAHVPETDTVQVQAVLRMRFLKGKRRTPEFKELTLRHMGAGNEAFDPLLALLALAFEDDIFATLKSPAALFRVPAAVVKNQGGRIVVTPKPDVADLRVCRQTVSVGRGQWETDPVQGQTYDTARGFLQKTARAAECTDDVTFFTFRRCMMDFLNSSAITDSDRKSIAGHNADSTVQDRAYVSRNSKVDTAAYMVGTTPLPDAAVAARGLNYLKGMPTQVSAAGRAAAEAEPHILAAKARARVDELKTPAQSECKSIAEARRANAPLYALQGVEQIPQRSEGRDPRAAAP